jgi:hypothetical protein
LTGVFVVRTRWFTDNPFIRERREAVCRLRYIVLALALYALATAVHVKVLATPLASFRSLGVSGQYGVLIQAVYLQQGMVLAAVAGVLIPLLTAIYVFREHSRNRLAYVQLTPIPRSAIVFGLLARELLTVGLLYAVHLAVGLVGILLGSLTVGLVAVLSISLLLSAVFGSVIGAAIALFFERSLTFVILTVLLVAGGAFLFQEVLQNLMAKQLDNHEVNFDQIENTLNIEIERLRPEDRAFLMGYLQSGLSAPSESARVEALRKDLLVPIRPLMLSASWWRDSEKWSRDIKLIRIAFPWWHFSTQGWLCELPHESVWRLCGRYENERRWWETLQRRIELMKHGGPIDYLSITEPPRSFAERKYNQRVYLLMYEPLRVQKYYFDPKQRSTLAAADLRQVNLAILLNRALKSPWPQSISKIPPSVLARDLKSTLPTIVPRALDSLEGYLGESITLNPNFDQAVEMVSKRLSHFGATGELTYLFNCYESDGCRDRFREQLLQIMVRQQSDAKIGMNLTQKFYSEEIRDSQRPANASLVAGHVENWFHFWDDEASESKPDLSTVASNWAFKLLFSILLFRWITQNLFGRWPRYLSPSIATGVILLSSCELATIAPYSNFYIGAVIPIGALVFLLHNKSQYGFEWHSPRFYGILYNVLLAALLIAAGMGLVRVFSTSAFPVPNPPESLINKNMSLLLAWIEEKKFWIEMAVALLVFEAAHQVSAGFLRKMVAGIIAITAGIMMFIVLDSYSRFAFVCLYALAGLQLSVVIALVTRVAFRRSRPPLLDATRRSV